MGQEFVLQSGLQIQVNQKQSRRSISGVDPITPLMIIAIGLITAVGEYMVSAPSIIIKISLQKWSTMALHSLTFLLFYCVSKEAAFNMIAATGAEGIFTMQTSSLFSFH